MTNEELLSYIKFECIVFACLNGSDFEAGAVYDPDSGAVENTRYKNKFNTPGTYKGNFTTHLRKTPTPINHPVFFS